MTSAVIVTAPFRVHYLFLFKDKVNAAIWKLCHFLQGEGIRNEYIRFCNALLVMVSFAMRNDDFGNAIDPAGL